MASIQEDWDGIQIMNPAFHRSRPIKTFGSVMPFLFSAIDENPDKVMISKQIKGFTLDALGLSVFGELGFVG